MTEWHAAYFQGIVTLGTAVVCWSLYRRYRRRDLLWWSVAWSIYVLRIGAIILFLATRAEYWLFVHQVLTGWTALALLWAALTSSRATRWRGVYATALVFPLAWSYVATYRLDNFLLAALPAVLFLGFATLWTGWVFLQQWRATHARGSAVLAGVLILWGLHHLNYPVLRAKNAWNPWGYYIDIMLVLGMAIGILMLVLDELDRRTRDLGNLSARMVSQHEDERRRISLELHDQSAQVWAAVKLQLGLVREQAPEALAPSIDRVLELVDSGIRSIRGVTTNLRPPLLDDLGLVPALRALVQSFAEQTGLDITFDAPAAVPAVSEEASLALYRALQEGLANAARHSGASAAAVGLSLVEGDILLVVTDNGRGLRMDDRNGLSEAPTDAAFSYGLSGMRQRITALHGSIDLQSTPPVGSGAALTVRIPMGRHGPA
ncbi:MAG TPA: sensor histidine kinase [Gemmatimonadaceae bacterium]|nr:sensor histidine kinase [Gemmatimonadaceae bacterium]